VKKVIKSRSKLDELSASLATLVFTRISI